MLSTTTRTKAVLGAAAAVLLLFTLLSNKNDPVPEDQGIAVSKLEMEVSKRRARVEELRAQLERAENPEAAVQNIVDELQSIKQQIAAAAQQEEATSSTETAVVEEVAPAENEAVVPDGSLRSQWEIDTPPSLDIDTNLVKRAPLDDGDRSYLPKTLSKDPPKGLTGPDPPSDWSKTAIFSMASASRGRPMYWQGVIALFQSLRAVKTKVPHLVALVQERFKDEIPPEFYEALDKLGAHAVDIPPFPETKAVKTPWFFAWNKLWVFNQTRFEKAIWMDSDTHVVENIDHLMFEPHFSAPITPEGCCNAATKLVMSGGLWVFRPAQKWMDRIIELGNQPAEDAYENDKGSNEWRWGDMQMVRVIFENQEQSWNKLNSSYDAVIGECDCKHVRSEKDTVISYHWACVMAKPWQPSFCCDKEVAMKNIGFYPARNYIPCVQEVFINWRNLFHQAMRLAEYKDVNYAPFPKYELPPWPQAEEKENIAPVEVEVAAAPVELPAPVEQPAPVVEDGSYPTPSSEGLTGPDAPKDWSKTAIITMATAPLGRPEYWQGAVALMQSLREVKTRVPHLIVMVVKGLDSEIPQKFYQAMHRLRVKVIHVPVFPTPSVVKTPWFSAWNKLNIFNLTQFEKVVWMDQDTLVVKNVDHLLYQPEFSAPLTPTGCCVHPDYATLVMSGGLWVLKPSSQTVQEILDLGEKESPVLKSPDDELFKKWHWGDMQMVRVIFEHIRGNWNVLGQNYDAVAGDCDCIHEKYVSENVYTYHWACVVNKPWNRGFCCDEDEAKAVWGYVPPQNFKQCIFDLYHMYELWFNRALLEGDESGYQHPEYPYQPLPNDLTDIALEE